MRNGFSRLLSGDRRGTQGVVLTLLAFFVILAVVPVALAEALGERMREHGDPVSVFHRDMER